MKYNFNGKSGNWTDGYIKLEKPDLFSQEQMGDMVEKLNPFLGQGGLRPVQRVIGYVSGVMSRGGLADTTGVYMGIHRRGREVHLGKLSVQLPGSDVQYQPERLVPGKRVPITEDEMRARGY